MPLAFEAAAHELLARVASIADRIVDIAIDHAALMLDLGNLVRGALLDGHAAADRVVGRAKVWETLADHQVTRIRDLCGNGGERAWRAIASGADDAADNFEETAFRLQFLPAGIPLEVRALFEGKTERLIVINATDEEDIKKLVAQHARVFDREVQAARITLAAMRERPVREDDIAPLARRLPIPQGAEDEAPGAEPPLVRVSGFVSRPEVQKLNRNSIYFFVNRRLVRDRLILHAVTEAYRNILPSSVFPVALIFLRLPAGEVDVNVHPSKTEVRFRNSGFIHDFVRDSIRQGLVASQPVAAFPMGRRATPHPDDVTTEAAERLADETPVMRGPASPLEVSKPQASLAARAFPTGGDFLLSARQPAPITGKLPLDAALSAYAPAQTSPTESATPASEFPADLVPLGQVQESFIVATNPDGLWIVDQHVAHERVLFERHLKMRREKKVAGQRLLLPIVVELRPEQQATFQEIAEELTANGFEVEPFGQRTVAVKTAPGDIRSEDVEKLLLEILDGVGPEARGISLESLRGKIAASVSCHAAIKINMALDGTKMKWLLRELARTDCPMTCPHGRPVVLKYSMRDIQKAFKRI